MFPSSSPLFLSYFVLTHLTHLVAPLTTCSIHTHAHALNRILGHSFAHEIIIITLLISTGRPDLAAVIMGSSPLACLRCCAAPVMSCQQPNSSSSSLITQQPHRYSRLQQHNRQRPLPKIQRWQEIYLQQEKKKKDPQLTFICLERSAARKKACRLSNRKSTCC